MGLSFVFTSVLVLPAYSSTIAHAQDYNKSWGITWWLTNYKYYYPGVIDKVGGNSRYLPPRYSTQYGTEFADWDKPLDPLQTPYSYEEAIDPNIKTCAYDAGANLRTVKGWYLTPSSRRTWDTKDINDAVHQNWEYWSVGWLSGGVRNKWRRWASFEYQIPKPTYSGCSIGNYQYYNGRYWFRAGCQIQLNATANDEEGWVRLLRLSIRDANWKGVTGYFNYTSWGAATVGMSHNLFSDLNISPSGDSGHQWAREYFNVTPIGEDDYTVYALVDNRSEVQALDSDAIDTGINISVDGTPPTLPYINMTSGVNNGWTSGNVSFTLCNSEDSRSGFNHYEYSIDGGGWAYYGGQVTIGNDGWHTIQARAVDNVGNASSAVTVYTGVDNAAPSANITVNPYSPNGTNGWYRTSTAPVVMFHAADSGSGIRSVTYSVTGADSRTNNVTFDGGTYTLPKEGTYNFTETVTDNVGNVAYATKTVCWDKTPPTGDVYVGWNDDDHLYLMVSNVLDQVSGVNNVYVVLTDKDNPADKKTLQLTRSQNDDSWQLGNTDILAMFAESYQVQADVHANDRAGNDSVLKSETLDLLKIFATVNHKPAKQGQELTFTISTVGNPVKLIATFPPKIGGMANIPITKQEILTTDYKYTLPLDIPLTLDPNGNKLLDPYVFTFTTQKANGKTASCFVPIDVQNNIYSGFRTRFRN
jgi:hypothetical protein